MNNTRKRANQKAIATTDGRGIRRARAYGKWVQEGKPGVFKSFWRSYTIPNPSQGPNRKQRRHPTPLEEEKI